MASFNTEKRVCITPSQRDAINRAIFAPVNHAVNVQGKDILLVVREGIDNDTIEAIVYDVIYDNKFYSGSLTIGKRGGIKENTISIM